MKDEPYDPDHRHVKQIRYTGTRLDISAMALFLGHSLGCAPHAIVGRALERGMLSYWKERFPTLPPPAR